MLKIERIIKNFFNRKYRLKNIFITEPAMIYVSKSCKLKIKKLSFNSQWDDIRKNNNLIAGSLYFADNSNINIGNVQIYAGTRFTVNNNAKFKFKSGFINYDSVIECFNNIEIGKGVYISERVQIRDSNNHTIIRDDYTKTAPIKIGNHVWIGIGAIILPGVTIGDGAIVGAGALVNKDIPPKALAVGCPAKVVRENLDWE